MRYPKCQVVFVFFFYLRVHLVCSFICLYCVYSKLSLVCSARYGSFCLFWCSLSFLMCKPTLGIRCVLHSCHQSCCSSISSPRWQRMLMSCVCQLYSAMLTSYCHLYATKHRCRKVLVEKPQWKAQEDCFVLVLGGCALAGSGCVVGQSGGRV